MNLQVNEIFYSLQGEGGRTGEASIFIRLTGCNLRCSFCDTDFEQGELFSLEQLHQSIQAYPCQWIVWTGGEPTLQLTAEAIQFFKQRGYLQAIESNGTRVFPEGLDYIVCSPKQNYARVRSMHACVHEIRLPVQEGEVIPSIQEFPQAQLYFLSPIFTDTPAETTANINYCVNYIKQHPEWRLSLQTHKLIGIE